MKNKFGLIGFVSLLGLVGLLRGNPMFLAFFAFAVFFQYWFVAPDELFVENMRRASTWSFFANLIITITATLVFSLLQTSSNAIAGGCALGFSVGIVVFCLSTSLLEWKEKRGAGDDA